MRIIVSRVDAHAACCCLDNGCECVYAHKSMDDTKQVRMRMHPLCQDRPPKSPALNGAREHQQRLICHSLLGNVCGSSAVHLFLFLSGSRQSAQSTFPFALNGLRSNYEF